MNKKILLLFISLLTLNLNVYAERKIENIVYIISDDLRSDVLGCYGNEICKTPNLDRLAKSGVLFEYAYAQGTACAPSRPSIMHSRYRKSDIIKNKDKPFPQYLKEKGWYSARVSKIFHMGIPSSIVEGTSGSDVPAAWNDSYNIKALEESSPGTYYLFNKNITTTALEGRQGARTPNRMFTAVKLDNSFEEQVDPKAAAKAIEILQQHKDKPFVLCVGLVRPHYPLVAPKNAFDMYPYESIPLPKRIKNDWDDMPKSGMAHSDSHKNGMGNYIDNQKRMIAAYYASVTFMDEQVGKLLDEIERLGLKDNTAVVFTSDHGIHLGEKEFWLKGNVRENVTHVPLLISAPGYKTGVNDSMVELVDIYPTIVDILGLEIPSQCEGSSLKPILEKPTEKVKDYALSIKEDARSGDRLALRTNQWAYYKYDDGAELYDMIKDPMQFNNLANNPEYKEELKQCNEKLNKKLNNLSN